MIALVVTNWSSAVLASIALRRLMGRLSAPPRYDVREIFAFSGLSWFGNLASNGLTWADTILLGIYGSPADVGVYQVATRLTLLATALINPVTTAFSPKIADLWRRQRYELLKKTYTLVTSWVFRVSLPSFVILLVFPREILEIFGPRFEAGVPVTIIMTLTWLFNAMSGPCGYMLTMSGRPKSQMINNAIALALNVGLNLFLIPRYGVTGAATAWGISIVFVTVARVGEVWAFSKIQPLSRDLVKGLVAGLAAAIAAFGIRQVSGGLVSLIIGIVAVGIVYTAGIALLGIDKDDRLVLDSLRQRLRPGKA
jgi:O-antigen/teichoic acid export membrane protein